MMDFYKSVESNLITQSDSVNIARKLLTKLIADESFHLKLLNDRLKSMINDEKKYNAVMDQMLVKVKLYTK